MSKPRKLVLFLLGVGVIAGIVLFAVGFFNEAGAGLTIETSPQSTVFVNGEQVGRTPYAGIESPGEAEIRLVPDSFDTPLTPYETRLTLVSGVETIVKQEFSQNPDEIKREIVSFEELPDEDTSIAILSEPDGASISVDGARQGFTPFKNQSILVGEHTLSVEAEGYQTTNLNIQVVEGYKLTARVKLMTDPTYQPEEIEEETQDEEITEETGPLMVEILSTPTNFLRVRSEPTTTSTEVSRVTPGKQYELIEEDEDSDWVKIKYEDDSEGWVSGEYVTIVDDFEGEEDTSDES